MNKDVIYIEPNDDITDIITKVESSKEKIVALVPPKKAGVFRSAVNIKLIAKAGSSAKKTIVVVTTDPSIVKLAATAKILVTKNLQTVPTVPEVEAETVETTETAVLEADAIKNNTELDDQSGADNEDDVAKDGDSETKEADTDAGQAAVADDEPEETNKKGDARTKANKKEAKNQRSNNFVVWLKDHKKLVIGGGVGIVALILFLVWAIAIAPAATITVAIRTTANNFSEGVSFTTNLEEENTNEGKFYLEEKKIEAEEKVNFEATGTKNIGEKAKGEVVIYAYFPFNIKGSTTVSAGEKFSISGLSYLATETVTLSYGGGKRDECENGNDSETLVEYGCLISANVEVEAAEPGANYNIAASSTGWTTTAPVVVYSESAMSGGTDDMITIVQQSDIDKAKSELATANEADNKAKLLDTIGDDKIVIDLSYLQTTTEAVASPAVGEEVKEGVTPTLKATTTSRIFVLDKAKIEEFITEKANLRDDQKIYEMKNPFVESFTKTDAGYTGRLKTSYATGPKLTENEIIEITKGKGLGDAQHALRDIDGVSSVTISTSFPWVTSIPNNSNKITVIFDVKE